MKKAAQPEPIRPYRDTDQPRWVYGLYPRSNTRHPRHELHDLPRTPAEISGPRFSPRDVAPGDRDLSRIKAGGKRAIGELMDVAGRVLGEDGKPMPGVLVEIWQANAAGKYRHPGDGHDAPLDPNFIGCGRAVTDKDGAYRFLTIKPGSYPMPGPVWRTPHLHFSLFGGSFLNRLITQTYFPDEPLNERDPILGGITDAKVRRRLMMKPVAMPKHPEVSVEYQFNFVLRGGAETPFAGR